MSTPGDYENAFPKVHYGVDSVVQNEIRRPFDFIIGWLSVLLLSLLCIHSSSYLPIDACMPYFITSSTLPVGSGYAGSFLARQIAAEFRCTRVLLLEAGGEFCEQYE
jgi:hypothetical protein